MAVKTELGTPHWRTSSWCCRSCMSLGLTSVWLCAGSCTRNPASSTRTQHDQSASGGRRLLQHPLPWRRTTTLQSSQAMVLGQPLTPATTKQASYGCRVRAGRQPTSRRFRCRRFVSLTGVSAFYNVAPASTLLSTCHSPEDKCAELLSSPSCWKGSTGAAARQALLDPQLTGQPAAVQVRLPQASRPTELSGLPSAAVHGQGASTCAGAGRPRDALLLGPSARLRV